MIVSGQGKVWKLQRDCYRSAEFIESHRHRSCPALCDMRLCSSICGFFGGTGCRRFFSCASDAGGAQLIFRRQQSTKRKANSRLKDSQLLQETDKSRIRNIGIIAHIDAGKTTTTERMLLAAGFIRQAGEVDSGDTVMDFLPQERERGITISSAMISFPWKEHRINLIDTPGHVDFTLEVERSLLAMDGVVVILDAAKGVQAQTQTVWRQASKFGLPALVFLNKMDKAAANVDKCLAHLEKKLSLKALPLQVALDDKALHFPSLLAGRPPQDEATSVGQARQDLYERLAECDDDFAQVYLESTAEDGERRLMGRSMGKVKCMSIWCNSYGLGGC
ncbi:hypothetical protein RvY_18986 [Ramazzottius varieornatus]|uniref:Tr-type G domain-containing protein n=1 Tax=Ramazzottius varieornatus TaxID=947166 RepID=A0A1D1W7R8_RAMVA|nr:hypothetical protein RvY_18986 [Ramazzottius varieornatus]